MWQDYDKATYTADQQRQEADRQRQAQEQQRRSFEEQSRRMQEQQERSRMHAAEMQRQAVSLAQAESTQRSNTPSYQQSQPYRHLASGPESYSTIFGQAGVACWRWRGKICDKQTEGIWKLIPKWCLMFILTAFSVIVWALEIAFALLFGVCTRLCRSMTKRSRATTSCMMMHGTSHDIPHHSWWNSIQVCACAVFDSVHSLEIKS